MARLVGLLVAVLIGGSVFCALPHAASADTVIESQSVDNGYPKNLTFKVSAHADTTITDATLSYAITGRGTSALGKPTDLTPGKSIGASVSLEVNSGASYIPVGSEFKYSWKITTDDGNVFTGPEQTFVFLPPNQTWKTVAGDFMIVYYHGDNADLANKYLTAGVETYDKIGKQLFNITLAQTPVRVILFNDENEMNDARPGSGGTFDSAVTTCGEKVTNNIVLVIPVSCGTPDQTDTLRHEFGHILNQTAGEGALGKLPSWLDEGTAVYAQLTPGTNFTGAFSSALKSNKLIPFAQMGNPTGDASKVNLFYGESYTMAKYLIDKKGPAAYAQFFTTIKKGTRFDDALKQVYGFDLAGFETEFVQANGGTAPTAGATAKPAQSQPTAAPTTKPANSAATKAPTAVPAASSTKKDDGIDPVAIGIIGAAVVFALVAVFFFLLSRLMSSGRKPPAG